MQASTHSSLKMNLDMYDTGRSGRSSGKEEKTFEADDRIAASWASTLLWCLKGGASGRCFKARDLHTLRAQANHSVVHEIEQT